MRLWRNTGARPKRVAQGSQDGAAAVEFALVVPLLAMLMMGIVTFGLAYSDHLALTNTVREGARFGATTLNVSGWGASVRDRTVQLYGNADNPLGASNVCALLAKKTSSGSTVLQTSDSGCNSGSTSAGTRPDTPSSIPVNSCFVQVWAGLPTRLNWLFGSTVITLKAKSVSAYDRTQACT